MTSKAILFSILLIAGLSVSAMANFLPDIQAENDHQNRLLTSFPYPGTTVDGVHLMENVQYSRQIQQGCDDKYSSQTGTGNSFEFTEIGVESGEYPYYTIQNFNSSEYMCSSGSNEVVMYTVPGENCYWYPLKWENSSTTYCFMNSVSEEFLSSRDSSQSWKINQQFYCGSNERWELPISTVAFPGSTIDQEPRVLETQIWGRNLVKVNGTFEGSLGPGDHFKLIEGGFDKIYGPYYYIYSAFNEVICIKDDDTVGDQTFAHVANCEWYLWQYQTGQYCFKNRESLWVLSMLSGANNYLLSKQFYCGTNERWLINSI